MQWPERNNSTNNVVQNITQKLKIEQHEPY